ncbi:hypothetical protein [Herbaspirillum huttiense]|jgi:hypothetical protein|uniref:Uncharacterized protein n=2 Tax=Herbaspirillum huttiense TaxID=863372 RepID=A0AAJ2HE12_9BURK|nr:hypothetical protein [Herbaspirillum huttiense]MDR9839699.1 hypothetical protein [Herbaspirillum huttiense]
MPTYHLRYFVDADNETREVELSLSSSVCPVALVEVVATAYRPEEQQEIGAIMESLSEDAEGLTQAQDFMAQMGILQIRYRIDGQGDEHIL